MESENYKSFMNKRAQLRKLWRYYYFQGNSKKALKISKDSLLSSEYFVQILTYAQLGDRKKVDSINKKFPWGTGRLGDWRTKKAIFHAVLKNSDSMYFYLENQKGWRAILGEVNGRPEFDPYRNEDRFKAFLRKNYLPVPSE